MLKRSREVVVREDMEMNSMNTLGVLLSLSQKTNFGGRGRVFECKTCHRKFPTFQALGGHRTSHKRVRAVGGDGNQYDHAKRKAHHECSICGLEFMMGQALGGHMRRHKPAAMISQHHRRHRHLHHLDMRKKSFGRASVLYLDLNLPAPGEEDSDFLTLALGNKV